MTETINNQKTTLGVYARLPVAHIDYLWGLLENAPDAAIHIFTLIPAGSGEEALFVHHATILDDELSLHYLPHFAPIAGVVMVRFDGRDYWMTFDEAELAAAS